MNRYARIAANLDGKLLPFRELVGEEMSWVLGQAIEEAAERGSWTVLRLFLKEDGEMPAAKLLEY